MKMIMIMMNDGTSPMMMNDSPPPGLRWGGGSGASLIWGWYQPHLPAYTHSPTTPVDFLLHSATSHLTPSLYSLVMELVKVHSSPYSIHQCVR